MAGRLKKIVDFVRANAFFKNLALVTLNLKLKEAGFDVKVEDFTSDTPDDAEIERVLGHAAKTELNIDIDQAMD